MQETKEVRQTIETSTLGDMLKNLTEQEFLGLGAHSVAYIRKVRKSGKSSYAIHAADGSELSITETESAALGAIFQNDMEAVTVH